MALPKFRYHVDPVRSGVFVRESADCSCCGNPREWIYVGPLYGVGGFAKVCPWCIADGSAANRIGAEFVDRGMLSASAKPEASEELRCRTPSYFSASGHRWPVHCGDYCELVADPPCVSDILRNHEDLRDDIGLLGASLGISLEQVEAHISDRASPIRFSLFRCVECGHHRLLGEYE